MKATLKKMTLINFKGERKREINFSQETSIFGANGTGKSRIANAFLWCLFGIDQQDRKDYEIRTRLSDGTPLYKEECSVEVELLLDDRTYTLKRQYVDEWISPRGEKNEIHKGNRTDCWIDGSPCTVSKYNEFVASILNFNKTVFNILSRPLFFSTIKWEELREILFMLIKEIRDEQLAEGNEDYLKLIEVSKGTSIAEYRKGLISSIAKIKEENDKIAIRISQTKKMKPENKDWAEIEKQIKLLDVQIENLNNQITNANERVNTINKPYEDTLKEIEYKEKKCKIALETAQAKENAFNKKENYQIKIDDCVKNITALNDRIGRKNDNSIKNNEKISEITEKRNILRAEFQTKQAEVWNGSNLCPTCNKPLESEQDFQNAKVKVLREINERNISLKKEREKLEKSNEELQAEIKSLQEDIEKLQSKQKEFVALLDRQKQQTIRILTYEDVEECKKLQAEITKLNNENATRIRVNDDEVLSQLSSEVKEKTKERDNLLLSLKDRETISIFDAEISLLESTRDKKILEKVELEHKDTIAMSFMEKKINSCEERINSMFSIVKFQLFVHRLNGNIEECCVPTINGVPFNSVNTAMQINGGLDVINTLSKFWNMSVPIFIDNRESVNKLIPTTAQLINLVVTEDKELVIK